MIAIHPPRLSFYTAWSYCLISSPSVLRLATIMSSHQTPRKNLTEKAVAMAFPELVNACSRADASDFATAPLADYGWLSTSCDNIGPDRGLLAHDKSGASCRHAAGRMHIVLPSVSNDAEAATSGAAPRDAKSESEEFDDRASSAPAVLTAHSEWGAKQRRHHDLLPPPPLRLKTWEKVLVAIVLLLVAACVAVTVAVILRHRRQKDAASDAVVADFPTAAPSSNGNGARYDAIREWLSDVMDDPVVPGTAQHDALFWLATGDTRKILGDELPSKQLYDAYQNGMPPSSSSIALVDETHAALVAFRIHIVQRYAMLVIFYSVIGVDGLKLGGWATLTGSHLTECIWPGAICRDDVALTSLALDNPTLGLIRGSLPTELGLLTNLGMTNFVRLMSNSRVRSLIRRTRFQRNSPDVV